MMKSYGFLNVDEKNDELIKKLKEWSKENFIFNNFVTYYSTYDNVKQIGEMPYGLEFPNYIRDKDKFDTPLSHLMYTLIELGKYLQEKEDNKVINKLRSDNEIMLNESKGKKNSSKKSNQKKSDSSEE